MEKYIARTQNSLYLICILPTKPEETVPRITIQKIADISGESRQIKVGTIVEGNRLIFELPIPATIVLYDGDRKVFWSSELLAFSKLA